MTDTQKIKFDSCDKAQFIDRYKHIASRDVLVAIWEYGGEQWKAGYDQGKNNPDFD